MHISTKGGKLKENQNRRSVNSIISMIQYTMPVPKGYSKLYEQFFDILTKAIALQLKLIEKSNTKNDDPMPKYKKYLEAKISNFLHSISPLYIPLSTSQSLSPSQKIQVKSRGFYKSQLYSQTLTNPFHNKGMSLRDKTLKTSYSSDGSCNNTPSLMSSSRYASCKLSIKPPSTTQVNSHNDKAMESYLKVAHPMLKAKHYSNASSASYHFLQDPLSSSLVAKSKSILKKYSTSSNQFKKINVTFKEDSNLKEC